LPETLTSEETLIAKEGFSHEASDTFFASVERYVLDLERMSQYLKDRSSADVVSAVHVNAAERALYEASTPKRARHLGSVGGVLLGTGLGILGNMMMDDSFTQNPVLLTFALCLVGVALMVYQAVMD